MVPEHEVDRFVERVGQELEVTRREVAATEHDRNIRHPLAQCRTVDSGIDLIGNGERLDRHADGFSIGHSATAHKRANGVSPSMLTDEGRNVRTYGSSWILVADPGGLSGRCSGSGTVQCAAE